MTRFDRILPQRAVSVETTLSRSEIRLLPDEAKYVHASLEKRKREFAAGRNCAREGLRRLGLPPSVIPVGPMRAPIFPLGVSGSITHAGDYCAAAVIRKDHAISIGIDAEVNQDVTAESSVFCTTEDLSEVERLRQDRSANWLGIIFSAKESFYKAWFQLQPAYLDFLEATVHIRPDLDHFAVSVNRPDAIEVMRHVKFTGRYAYDSQFVYTAVTAIKMQSSKGMWHGFESDEI